MIPTQGKMTPPATWLMKSLLHWDGPHISGNKSPVLFWVPAGAVGWEGWGRGSQPLPPPLLGLPWEAARKAAQSWMWVLPPKPNFVFKSSSLKS